MRSDEGDKPSFSRAILMRVWGYARPYLPRILIMLVVVLLMNGVGLVPPLLMRDLIDNALPNGDGSRLNLLALGMVAVPILSGLLGMAQRYIGAVIGESVICDLRCAVYNHLQLMSLRFFTDTKTGEIMSRLNNDVVGAQRAVSSTLVSLVSNAVAAIATVAIMISLDWRLTLISMIVLPLFLLPGKTGAPILRRIVRQQMTLNAQLNALANETLNVSGALIVKLFGRTETETSRYAARAGAVRDIGVRQALVGQSFGLIFSLTAAVGTAIVFWVGGQLVLSGVITTGTIVAFGVYLSQLYGPLSALANARVDVATALVSFERVFEVVDMPIEIAELPAPVVLTHVTGRVEFDRVSFSYFRSADAKPGGLSNVVRRGRAEVVGALTGALASDSKSESSTAEIPPAEVPLMLALENVSFTADPGQLIALVGPSGAGKTTTTYLLPRLYDPTDGRITIDGHDLRELSLSTLAENIGMVTQETYLFHDTIRANLLYAKPNASQAEIESACQAANIAEMIESLPERYDTVVGERGYRLSGGEKQRIAIARVILKDPRILVLDEATSHLDSRSEALIQAALERVMAGRTSIVIAHRLSTILKADRIVVLDHGQVVESGTHRDLMARGGLYAHLFETQFQRVDDEALFAATA